MVVAKSRLKKVANVRKKLHNYKGTPSQRVREMKIKTIGAIRKAAHQGVSKAKSVARTVASKFKMPPPTKLSQSTIQNAVSNVQQLQSRVPKKAPLITTPSPASMKPSLPSALKGPSRPPPPPPNQTPMRPTIQGAKVAPRVPPKPMALKGRKL